MAKRHQRNASTFVSLPLAASVAMLAVLPAAPALADWKVVPAVELRETYSDNVRLESAENARGQFITELSPSVTVLGNGPRLKVSAAAVTHLYAYSERLDGTNNSLTQLQADARAKLIEDLLYLDGAASIGQQAISAFGPQVNNGYSNTNQARVSTWRLSPYLVHRFGNTATSQVRYTRDSVQSGNAFLGDSTSNALAVSIRSGSTFTRVGWGLQANRQDVNDSLRRDYQIDTAQASLNLRVNNELTLDGTVGYDKYDYASPGTDTAGRSHTAGFTWTPSLRTSIQASVGRRFFGPSYLLALSHRSRRTVWGVNYNDAVTTTREQLMIPATVNAGAILDKLFSTSIADPEARRLAVDAYIRANGLPPSLAHNVNYFTNRFMLQRAFQATAAFNTARTTSVLAINANRREALSTLENEAALVGAAPIGLNDSTRQAGASALTSYRLSPRTAISLALNTSRTESLTTGIKDNQHSLRAAATSQLRKIKGSVELRHTRGSAAVLGGRAYRENAISASLSYQL